MAIFSRKQKLLDYMSGNKYGFSLVELMIVIALTMILVSLAAINTRYLNKAAITAEINLLYAACHYLQQVAITHNQQQELVFDSSKNSYTIDGQCHQLPKTICFGVLPDAKGPPSSPHNTLSKAITFANNIITFSPDGIISSGAVYLTDSRELYALSSSVAHASFLRTYRYDGKWHLM